MLYEVITVVRTVFEDESFRIWMGTWHDGLFYTQPNSEIRNLSHFSYSNDKKGLLTTLIHTISQDNRITSYNVCYTKLLRHNRYR